MAEPWRVSGAVLVTCNCDWGCPCNFQARPSKGNCEGGWTWHIERGSYGNVSLDGLNCSVYVNWPGAIHEGNGEALILVDAAADQEQRAALESLVGGTVGGPWGVLSHTWPKVHGPFATTYDLQLDGVRTRLRCGDYVEVEGTAIRNPVTHAEAFPSVSLPQGLIFKQGDFGASATFRVRGAVSYDHSGQYLALGRFDYKGP